MDAFPSPRELLKIELAEEVLRRFGHLRLRVTGSSMLPTVQPDDVVVIHRCRVEQAGPGDIILFIRNRRLFAHRVVSLIDGATLLTQGDSIAHPDPRVTANELLGKVVRVTRRETTIRPQSKLTLQAHMAAALFRRSTMAIRVFSRLQVLRFGT